MKKFAVLSLAVLLALPASAAGVNLGGYIDIGYIAAESDFGGTRLQASGATNGNWNANDAFTVNELNLDLSSQLTNDISAFASIDWAPGSTQRVGAGSNNNLTVDYAYVDIANPGPFDLNVRAGLIPSVTGIEQRVSESNQNRFINLSLLSPLMVGSNAGLAVYGSFSPINYALAVTNGDVMDGLAGARDNSTAARAGTLAGEYALGAVNQMNGGIAVGGPRNNNGVAGVNISNVENNNDKALSGRLGVVPIEGLEVGLSYSLNDIAIQGDQKNRTRKFIAADASYAYGPFSVKGEWISADEENTQGVGFSATSPKTEVRGWSAELGYDLSSKVGLGARYARVQTENPSDQALKNDFSTLAVAGVYRLADNVQLKAEYDINKEHVLGGNVISTLSGTTTAGPLNEVDNDVLAVSLVGSF